MFKALSKFKTSSRIINPVGRRSVHYDCDYILNKYPTVTGVVAALTGATFGSIILLYVCEHDPEDYRRNDDKN